MRGSTERMAVLRNGLRLPVNVRDFNGRMLYLFGTPDPKIVLACRGLLRPGDCFLDIGANYGAVGLMCRDAVGHGGSVHLFEPQPDLCRRIRECITGAGLTNVHLHDIGLLDRDDELQIRCETGHSGSGSFYTTPSDAYALTVPVRDIEQYVPPLVNSRPLGVKLDVEGAEPVLLPWILRQPQLRFVAFECSHLGDQQAVWEAVNDARCVLYGFQKTLLRVRLSAIRKIGQLSDYHDVVAVRLSRGRPSASFISPGALRDLIEDTAGADQPGAAVAP